MDGLPDNADEMGEDEDEERPATRRRGRPPKRRGRPPKNGERRVTTTTRQEYVEPPKDEDEDEDEDVGAGLLFSEAGKLGVSRVRVSRREPNEGVLGYLEDGANATEKEISERWGGGTFLVQGLNPESRIVKAATVRIAGDPIFVSTMAKLQWEQARRRMTIDVAPSVPAAIPQQPQMSMQEMLTFMREQETLRLTAEREHQERMRKLDEAAEDRRRRDDEERDRRRKADEEERERRRRQEQEEAEKRAQSHLQQTIAMMTAANTQTLEFMKASSTGKGGSGDLLEAIKAIAVIKDTFGGNDGGNSDADMDPVSLLIKEGPKWLEGIGGALGGAIREYKGNPAPAAAPATQRQLSAANPAAGLPLPATLAPKVMTLVSKITEKGGDPEQVLSEVLDHVTAKVDKLEKIPAKPVAQQVSPSPSQPSQTGGQAEAMPSAGPSATPTVTGKSDPLSRIVRLPFVKPKARLPS